MKRLRPVSMTAVSNDEVRLRCKPKFDSLSPEESRDLMIGIRARSLDAAAEPQNIEAEFPFKFAQNGALLQDAQFILLTSDDYSELWINSAVDNFSLAYEEGFTDPTGTKLKPTQMRVGSSNETATRRYDVVFVAQYKHEQQEFVFTVSGGSGNQRTIAWTHGTYSAKWNQKDWTFESSTPADLKSLLTSVLRMDESIHPELMPYARS